MVDLSAPIHCALFVEGASFFRQVCARGQGIFGTEDREQETLESDITATVTLPISLPPLEA